jgi:PAS domain S-box-containing protein
MLNEPCGCDTGGCAKSRFRKDIIRVLPRRVDLPSIRPANAAAIFAAIVESSDDIIVSKTLDGIITSWNPAAERILGYKAEEAIGKHITLIVPDDRLEEENEVLAKLRRGEKVDHFETVRRGKDGTLLNLSITVSPVRDEQGKLIGASKIARDISERKRLDEQREKLLALEKLARTEAESASRLKDEFLAMVSHELRSPLNAISGWVTLLQSGSLSEERAAHGFSTILRSVRTQDQLIEDLLDISTIVSGRFRVNVRPFDLISTIEAAVAMFRPSAELKGLRLQTIYDSDGGAVAGDPDRLQQVFSNLLSNAMKFTAKGGRVQIRLERINSHVEISVSDTGEGIEPEFLPHVFELFRQGESGATRQYKGLGLGLGIARSIVELHGGTITAHSEGRGKGAQFVVRLPLVISAPHHSEGPRVHPKVGEPVSGELPSLAGIRVLLVDDEADALEVLSTMLSKTGAEVLTATSADQAFSIFMRHKPTILVSDLGMPGTDGYTLLERIRALKSEEGARVPAVALTAFARGQDRLKALAAGFQVHVAKPVDFLELATIIKIVVEKSANSLSPTGLT